MQSTWLTSPQKEGLCAEGHYGHLAHCLWFEYPGVVGKEGVCDEKSLPMCLISYCSPISHNLVMHLHLFCVLLQDERILSDGPLHKLLLEQLRVPVHWVAQLFCFEAPQSSCRRITKNNPRDVFLFALKVAAFVPESLFFHNMLGPGMSGYVTV